MFPITYGKALVYISFKYKGIKITDRYILKAEKVCKNRSY